MKTLAKLATYIAILLLFSMYSCGNDKDKEEKNIEEIDKLFIGTWEESSCISYKNEEVVPNHWSKWASWTFNKDGSLERFSSTYKDYGSYSINGKHLSLLYKVKGTSSKEGWTEKYTVEIISLTETELVWKQIYPDDEYDYEILTLEK